MRKHPIRCPYCNRTFDAEAATPDPDEELSSTDETVALEIAPAPAETTPEKDKASAAGRNFIAASSRRRQTDAVGIGTGEYFGDYEIIREIARGGMGIIYLARQRKLRRTVALKVLRAGEGASDEDISRFLREAEAAASLAHPNIVPIHELDIHKGRAFFTMDYIEGPSLETMIAEGRLTLRRSVQILEEIALAIHYAHGKGIIHRDLKPANVILAPDRHPMITDFGLAVNLSRNPATQRMTHSGVVMGTIPYIPPEQAAGDVDQVGPAGDVYSLGAILYEMITGKPPFEGETQFELLHCVINRDPVPPRRLNPKIPVDLQTICLKCLEKSIPRRYASARALADDCRAYLNREVIQARPATPVYRALRLVSRHRGLSILGALAFSLAVIFFFVANSLRVKKEKVEKRQVKIEKQLEQNKQEVRKLVEEKEELTASLERGWRLVFEEDFSKDYRANWLIARGQAKFARNYLILRGNQPGGKAKTVNAALKNSYPGDCQIEFKVSIPEKNGAAIGLLVSGKSLQLDGNFGYLFTLGSPSAPGIKIEKGPVVLAKKENFFLTPEIWHTVVIERNGKKLSIHVDGSKALAVEDGTVLHSDEYTRIGFTASEGFAYLDEIRVFQPGSSPQMLVNMLDMADNIYRHGRLDQIIWAIEMSEQVAVESNDPGLHLRALRRCVACYLRFYGSFRQAKTRLDSLIAKLKKSTDYKFQPGEADYLNGLLELQNQNYLEATRYFDKVARIPFAQTPGKNNLNLFPLLGHLEGVLARIRQGAVDEVIDKFTEMQRDGILSLIATTCRKQLLLSNANVILLAEIDRLLDEEEANRAWSFMEALRVLFPEGGRDLAARYMALAKIYAKNQEWPFAIDLLKKATTLAPKWEKPLLALGDTYLSRGDHAKALEILSRASKNFPKSASVSSRLAAFLLTSKDQTNWPKAVAAARKAVALSAQKDPAALELLARALLATGEPGEAAEVLKTAIALKPDAEELKTLKTLQERIITPVIQTAPEPKGKAEEAAEEQPAPASTLLKAKPR